MKLRVVIVEDESLGIQRLRRLLLSDPEVEIVAECAEGPDAVQQIRALRPDVVFLDIQLPGISGLEVLRQLQDDIPPIIIFTTAFENHAVQAFEGGAADYLLKPFDRDRIQTALRRARLRLGAQAPSEGATHAVREWLRRRDPVPTPAKRLAVKSDRRICFVETSDIDWVSAADNYVELHAGKSTHLLRMTLSNLERKLPSNQFQRISRSRLVNLNRVAEIRSKPHGDFEIVLQIGTILRGSRNYRSLLDCFTRKSS
jgi:two-component system LytT family response regulator